MIKTTITLDHTIEILNIALKKDPVAMKNLLNTRVKCNEGLLEIPVGYIDPVEKICRISFLGILNGIFGVDSEGWGAIAAEIDDDGNIVRFVDREREKRDGF